MVALEEFSDLLSAVYDAALDVRQWEVTLERLALAFGASQVVLSVEDRGRRAGTTLAFGADKAYVRSYLDYFMHRNPLAARNAAFPVGSVMTDRMVVPREEFRRSEFRNDFLRPQDVETCLSAIPWCQDGQVAAIALWRPERREEWDQPELELLSLLTPHIRRAIKVNQRLSALRRDRDVALNALDRLRYGVIFVGANGRASIINRAAAEILARGDGLTIEGSRLRARSQDAALQRAIGSAVVGDANGTRAGSSLALSRLLGGRPLAVHVLPSHGASEHVPEAGRGAFVLIVDPERDLGTRLARARQLYGLTPAEAAVAAHVLRGQGLKATASALGVTLSTVRVHLQHVFEKTQTHRQAELVRLLLDYEPGIRAEEQQP